VLKPTTPSMREDPAKRESVVDLTVALETNREVNVEVVVKNVIVHAVVVMVVALTSPLEKASAINFSMTRAT
jgi:hypothetical protein